MRPRRSFLLLEVIVGLALLGLLGVWLVKLQGAALRQVREARLKEDVRQRVEQLLWEWSSAGVRVTLPASGDFSQSLAWRREIQPIRVANGLIAPQVTLIVTETLPHTGSREVYRVDWLVPRKPKPERP
jgi:hypothetical protein